MTQMYFSPVIAYILQRETNTCLDQLHLWFVANQLELNTSKTKYIIFIAKNKPITNTVNISFQNSIIERVESYKFLGVHFHENLYWTAQVNDLRKEISRSIGLLFRCRQLLPNWLKRQIYTSMIHSRLYYCLLVWGTTTRNNIKQLLTLQRRAVRLIDNLPRFQSTSYSFNKHKILKVDNYFV